MEENRYFALSFLQFFILICCLTWSYSNAQYQSDRTNRYPVDRYNNYQESRQSKQAEQEKSPLVNTLLSRLTEKKSSATAQEEQSYHEPHHAPSLDFLTAFQKHLQKGKTVNPNVNPNLGLFIEGGSFGTVQLSLFPDNSYENFNIVVDLLADALALVIQEAEKLGFRIRFGYSVDVAPVGEGGGAGGYGTGPELNLHTLKNNVG